MEKGTVLQKIKQLSEKQGMMSKIFYATIAALSGTLSTGISVLANDDTTTTSKEIATDDVVTLQDTTTIPADRTSAATDIHDILSTHTLVTDSQSQSEMGSESTSTTSTSMSTTQMTSTSVSQSTTESTSTSQEATVDQVSLSASLTSSMSMSTSTSEMASTSESTSLSTVSSTSMSMSTSTSMSDLVSTSQSTSLNASETNSLSQAHALSESVSTSQSLSAKTPPRPVVTQPIEQTRPTTSYTPVLNTTTSGQYISTPITSTFNLDNVLKNMTQKQFKLSDSVLQWKDLVTKIAEEQGMKEYVPLILAIIQVESNGTGTKDIMQSSESAGHPANYFQSEEESVRQGISHLRSVVEKAASYNKGYEKNMKLVAQAYNYGSGFIDYVHNNGGFYNLSIAQKYSKEVVAPSLGNKTGEMYKYSNFFSQAAGNEFLYLNGGNYYYGNIVTAFVYQEFSPILMALDEFQGQEYVFGGKNPAMGFDCSGLVSWGLEKLDISLPSYTVSQWDMTTPVSLEDARPGDLIFFKGTYGDANFISHVEFYVDENTMFGSNGNGVGYHNIKDSYWQQHFAGVRRVTQLSQVFDTETKLNLNQ